MFAGMGLLSKLNPTSSIIMGLGAASVALGLSHPGVHKPYTSANRFLRWPSNRRSSSTIGKEQGYEA
jgi:hypothetical protein